MSATHPDITQSLLQYCFAFYMEISSRTHTKIHLPALYYVFSGLMCVTFNPNKYHKELNINI